MDDKAAILKNIAREANLRGGATGVEGVMRGIEAASKGPNANFTEKTLARILRMPVPVVTSVCRELLNAGLLEPEPPLRLSTAGMALIGEGISPGSDAIVSAAGETKREASEADTSAVCLSCGGSGILPTGEHWKSVLAGLRRYVERPASPEILTRRVAFMHDQGALAGKDVLVIGDDLSPAVAVALAGKALSPSGRLARRVVALHYDERRLRHLRDIAVAEGVIIGLIRHDVRQALMEDLLGEFGTVWVTPPMHDDVTLYLSKAIDTVTPEDGRIYLLLGAGSPDQQLEAQRAISEMGLLIEQMLPERQRNQLFYSLRVTNDTAPLIEDADADSGEY